MTYDLAIIGGGPAGYSAAELAAKSGLKTILFEKKALGGVCLNEGCIPTKTLLYSAKVMNTAKDSAKYGISCENVSYDLSKIIARKNKVVRKLVAGIKGRMNEAGVEVIIGEAQLLDGTSIECNGSTYEAKKVILCTGSEAVVPPIPGLKEANYWTSREALENKEVPESILIIGGGVIGVEFASFFNSLGTKVMVVEMMPEILPGMDQELAGLLRTDLTKKGIDFHMETKVVAVNGSEVSIEKDGEAGSLSASVILVSVGRRAVGKQPVNEYMQTENPNIYACGDITGFSMLAHTAVRESEVAVEHILGKNHPMSYKAVPGVVYSSPEFAGVGKTEEALQGEGIEYIVKKLPMAYSGRFVAENEMGSGVCKIIESTDGTILGVHLLGNPASELIVIAGLAIEQNMKSEQLKAIIFPHPTVGEIIKEAL
ncbi:dihydrolipoyl dehydrogenase [Bacteroidales bacterium OttesenSCG-928-M11]|nr:dihydrolipoyl dehydrogenase [Bacteroidales bacterium OttesenSCG-928-M11]